MSDIRVVHLTGVVAVAFSVCSWLQPVQAQEVESDAAIDRETFEASLEGLSPEEREAMELAYEEFVADDDDQGLDGIEIAEAAAILDVPAVPGEPGVLPVDAGIPEQALELMEQFQEEGLTPEEAEARVIEELDLQAPEQFGGPEGFEFDPALGAPGDFDRQDFGQFGVDQPDGDF